MVPHSIWSEGIWSNYSFNMSKRNLIIQYCTKWSLSKINTIWMFRIYHIIAFFLIVINCSSKLKIIQVIDPYIYSNIDPLNFLSLDQMSNYGFLYFRINWFYDIRLLTYQSLLLKNLFSSILPYLHCKLFLLILKHRTRFLGLHN